MYGLADDTDLSFFNNIELSLVAVGKYSIRFVFENDIDILVHDSRFEHFNAAGVLLTPDGEFKDGARSLPSLIGQIAVSGRNDDGVLVIDFDNGESLRLYDDSEHYESYVIGGPNIEIIV